MSWIRLWNNVNLEEIARYLLVVGISNAECFSCHKVGISQTVERCPSCNTEFKYVAFRKRVKNKDLEIFTSKNLVPLDFEDFLKEYNRLKAKKIFGSFSYL